MAKGRLPLNAGFADCIHPRTKNVPNRYHKHFYHMQRYR